MQSRSLAERIPPLHDPPSARRLPLQLHAHLRDLILEGSLPPGIELAQAEVARILGVSRIPLREAFRMLQQEGLIDATPDRRATVAKFDIVDQDGLWASRIMLEGLRVRMTAGRLKPEQLDELASIVDALVVHYEQREAIEYRTTHRRFHELAGSGAGALMQRTIHELYQKTPFFRSVPDYPFVTAEGNARRHLELVELMREGDPVATSRAAAREIGESALDYLHELDPTFEPHAVHNALEVMGVGPIANHTYASGRPAESAG